jgi:hypothetical protein
MMKKAFLYLMLIAFHNTFLGCKSEKVDKQPQIDFAYPPLPDTLRQRLVLECTQIEYLFTQGFSASSSTPAAVVEGIDHTSSIPVDKSLLNQCVSVGRNQFLIGFDIALEADIYFSEPDCYFFIYKKKGEYLYSGMLKDNGKKFFESVFNSANPY